MQALTVRLKRYLATRLPEKERVWRDRDASLRTDVATLRQLCGDAEPRVQVHEPFPPR